ncbi:transposase [Vibrio panuliri]|uniref:transposase n=1 Tax=Vibrio panuliri TaxID=1381081 RepID=UPI0015C5408E|nr:transposase [Vibrio panuliri]
MTTARKHQVSVDATPYYHCVSRCVRRSFLCGIDPFTERSYEHRREWIKRKIECLAQVYCIDVCAYAIMSNHYHLVVHINRDKAQSLSHFEVVERWRQEHKLPSLVSRWLNSELTSRAEIEASLTIIESWRTRLWSLSWFMKELNFDIACQANREDECRGHFWESRFKSQALLDEQALLTAMAYVDLNPLRAGEAETPENAEFTSIRARMVALKRGQETAPYLYPFTGVSAKECQNGIPFRLLDYIELVDWSARQYREGKASMSLNTLPILQRLNLTQSTWLIACKQLERQRCTAVGCSRTIEPARRVFNKKRIHLFRLDG